MSDSAGHAGGSTPSGRLERGPTDEELLRALAVDRTGALGALYDRYGGLVYGLAKAILSSPEEAQDVTQETFLGLGDTYWRFYDPARGALPAFLVTMARSRALDRLRARARKSGLLDRWGYSLTHLPPADDPHAQASLSETRQRVRQALAGLPEDQRRVLDLVYFQGLTHREIATSLDVPLGTVKSWARRGLFALRDALGDLVEPS